jgi:hypothetical protein
MSSSPVDIVDVLQGLYNHLTGNNTFNTAIGGDSSTAGRLFFGRAAKGTAYPYATYTVVSIVDDSNMTQDGYSARVQFDIWESESAGPRACLDVCDALRAELHKETFTVTNITQMKSVLALEIAPVPDDKSWHSISDYTIAGFRD